VQDTHLDTQPTALQRDIGIGFGNPDYSDAKVVLTSESLEAFRARAASSAWRNAPQQAKQSAGAPSAAAAGQEVQVTKLVLCSQSQYFKAAFEWQRNRSSQCAGSKRLLQSHRDGTTAVFVMSLAVALFPTARTLLKFLYTHTLDAGMDRTELLQLLRLADEHEVAELRCACLQQLNQAPLDEWAPAETKMLHEVAVIVVHKLPISVGAS
jgi:hypothetical protein